MLSLFLLAATLLSAQKVYTPDNLPKVHLQDRMQYVCNPSDILSQTACDSINTWLYALEQQTGIETVVAVVPSIGETECFDFCHELLNSWGVGKERKDNGLVVLLVVDQRCIQFYTGYGLESDLPDIICKRIQMREMIPYLRDNHWDEAMLAGMKSVVQRLENVGDNNTGKEEEETTALFIAIGLMVGGFGLIAFFCWLAWYQSSRCPNCGQRKLKRINSRIVSYGVNIIVKEVTYICQNCGHQLTRKENHYNEAHLNRRSQGTIFSGHGFGGMSSGGSFGGSFGGGRGGGGGAGSRF